MKTIRLLNLLLMLALLLTTAPIARTVGSLNAPSNTGVTESPPFDLAVREPVGLQGRHPSAISALSAPSTIQSPNTGTWQIECVDCPKQFANMTDRSLQLDDDGHPHIAYGQDHLYYAWHDGTEWHHETVDKANGVGEFASLALDRSSRPRISYYDLGNAGLKYARYDGTSWHIETVDSASGDSSLALDEAGRPHISYASGGDLKYAWQDGSSWWIETLDTGGDDNSLALDEAGHPHISYRGGEYGDLKYAWRDATSWQFEAVELYTGSYISLALDEADHPHISYASSGDLKYAWRDGTVWHTEIVDGDGINIASSLALDGLNRPHISYYQEDYRNLKYGWYDGTDWQIETVDGASDEDGYWSTSLALDGASCPHISYLGGEAYKDLVYAWHDGTTWQVETVDESSTVGYYTSLAVDGADRPHVSYYKRNLKYAWHNGTGWQIETVDSGDGDIQSLALSGAGRPHIAYEDCVPCIACDGFEYELKYAWHDGWDWQIETITNSGWDRIAYHFISLALDGSDRPHISYCVWDTSEFSCGDLGYAWHDGMAWQIETVDSGGSGYTSLALDGLGQPHISYYDWDHGDLKYAWRDAVDWHIEAVDRTGDVGAFASLALDGSDRPHISYYDGDHEDIKYAWHDGADWHIETVDNQGGTEGHTLLALDEAGQPHISYYSSGCLKYAQHDGTAWHIETVDSNGDVGKYASLALDGTGQPHISYYDNSNHDLKYAWLMPPPLSLNKQAMPHDDLRNNETLTYTLTLSGPGLSVRLWDPLPAPVRYVSGSLTGTLTPPAVYSPTVNAIVWQGTLPTDTVQTVRFQVTPGLTGTGSLSLSLPIVNTAWLTDIESNFGVSAAVIVNGWRVYLPLTMR